MKIEIEKLLKRRTKIDEQIAAFCENCPHENATRTPQARVGGYDYPDKYWYDCRCNDCGKKWLED